MPATESFGSWWVSTSIPNPMTQEERKMVEATKVGKGKPGRPKMDPKDKKEPKVKIDYIAKVAVPDAIDENGKLKDVPQDFDATEHVPLKREHFSEDHVYLTFRGNIRVAKGKAQIAAGESDLEQANIWKKFGGNPAQKNKFLRASKMVSKLKELMAQLKAEGVDTTDLLGDSAT